MTRMDSRIRKLEEARGKGTYCLLYTAERSKQSLAKEVAVLEQTHARVLTFLVDEDDLVEPFRSTTRHEDALDELD